jgi:hypothetical protein
MAVYRKFYSFSYYLSEVFTTSETFQIDLTNNPPLQTYTNISDITLIDYTYYTPEELTFNGSLSTGIYSVNIDVNPVILTASGGSVGPFRYIIVRAVSAGDLCCYYDYGYPITLTSGQSLTLDFSGSKLFTVA